MEDGQTFVIGGLIQRSINSSTSKVPVLGDVPFLGAAFSSKSFTETESELVILVTPHLVDAMACDQAPKILPGQETRSPDDFELFLEGILEAPRGPRVVCPIIAMCRLTRMGRLPPCSRVPAKAATEQRAVARWAAPRESRATHSMAERRCPWRDRATSRPGRCGGGRTADRTVRRNRRSSALRGPGAGAQGAG